MYGDVNSVRDSGVERNGRPAATAVHVDPRAPPQRYGQPAVGALADCEFSEESVDEDNRYPQRCEPAQPRGTMMTPPAATVMTGHNSRATPSPRAHQSGGPSSDSAALRRHFRERADHRIISQDDAHSLFLGASVLNLFFTILGTSLSQLDEVGGACFTFWGYKVNCDSVSYTIRAQLLPCDPLRRRLQTGAAFSIISICLMVGIIFSFLRAALAKYMARNESEQFQSRERGEARSSELGHGDAAGVAGSSKWVVVGLAGATALCEIISWAMTVSVYVSRFCEDSNMDRNKVYGPGFALLVVGTLLFLMALGVFVVKA